MTDEIARVGIAVETDSIAKGEAALDSLASKGPKVEQALDKVEQATKRTGKTLASLGQGGADSGLTKVGKSGADAAAGVDKLATAAAKTSQAVSGMEKSGAATAKALAGVGSALQANASAQQAMAGSLASFARAEASYVASLADETRQLRATLAEREKYIAQTAGMLSASKELAAAVGAKVDAYRAEQNELRSLGGASRESSESLLALTRTGVAAFLGSQVVQGAKAAAAAIYEASAAGERLRTMLNFASGGNGAKEIDYLRQVTERLGLQFAGTSRAYGKFQAAARGTSIEGAKAQEIFESIAKASAVMGLSTEQSSGALLALQQMISKGTVQAEELRGQLGERLPGAFQIAAKAMGVTTAELGKMLEAGQVIADDFLPKFAKALNENLGNAAEGAAQRLDAAVNRFDNAWERLKQTVGDSGIASGTASLANAATKDLQAMTEAIERARVEGSGLVMQLSAGAGSALGRSVFGLIQESANLLNGSLNTLSFGLTEFSTNVDFMPTIFKTSAAQAQILAADLATAEKRFAELQKRGAATDESFYLRNEYFQLGKYIERLKEAQAEQSKLGGTKDPRDQSGFTSRGQSFDTEAKRLEGVQTAMQKVLGGLSGVKDSFQKDLAALYKGYDAGLIKIDDYRAAVQKLINESGGGKVNAAGLKAINKELDEQAKLIAELAGLSGDFSTDWDRLNSQFKAGKINLDQLTKSQSDLLAKQPAMKAARENELRLIKSIQEQYEKTAEEVNAYYLAESKAREKGRLAVYEYAMAIDEQNAATQFEFRLIGKTQQARDVAIAQYRIELELKKQIAAIDSNAGFDEAQRIEERAKARAAAAKAMAGAETRAYVDEWQRAADKINDSLTDALLRGFESGKDFAENLRDTVVNMFKTMVLRPVISAVISPIAGGITGLLGLSGAANAASAAGGLLGGAGSIFGSAASLSGIGSAIGAGFMNTITGGTLAGGQAAGLLAGGASTGSGIAGLAGAALPWVGAAALVGNALGLFRKTEYKGTSLRGTLGEGDINAFDVTRKGGSLFSGPKWRENDRGEAPVSDSIQMAYEQMRMATAGMAEQLGLNGEAIRKYTQSLYIDGNGKSPEEMQKLLAEAVTAANESLAQFALGTTAYSKEGETASQTLARLSGGLQGVNYVLDELSQTTLAVSLAGGDMADQLAGLFGGLDSFVQTAGSYYQNYYSEAERAAKTTEQITKGLAEFGIALPASRDAFRALVEAQDLTTESGRKAYAALLQLSPAFASVVSGIEAVESSAVKMAEAGRAALASLAEDQSGLMVDLLRAQGNTSGADSLAREQLLAGLTKGLTAEDAAAAIAASDYNAALRRQIETLNEAAGLQNELLRLQGDTAAIRAAELAALDPANRALQEQINALLDQQAAAEKAAAALQAFEATLGGLGSTRFDLENQLLGLQGKDSEVAKRIRERDLAELTKGLGVEDAAKVTAAYDLNNALRAQIAETQAAQAAAQALAQAQQQAAQDMQRAAEQVKSAWQSITDSIYGEVQRIRGLISGDAGQTFAGAQAEFAIRSAQARAGDQEAAKLLPGLSQTLLQLAEAQATSLFELQRIRAQTAASLTSTGGALASQYGLAVPKLATGTNYVPRDTLAVIHEGEAVVPRAYNPAAGGQGAGNAELVAEMRALRAENKQMAEQILKLQTRQTELMDRWEFYGVKERTE